MMRTPRPKHLGALILATALIPPLAFQFEFTTAVGLIAVSIMILMTVLMKGHLHVGSSTAVTQVGMGVGLLLVYLLSCGIVSLLVYQSFDFWRFFQSLIFLCFCLTGAYYFSAFVNSYTEEQVDNALRFVFMVILFSGVPHILGIHLSGGESSRTLFFYNEPSHYALGFAPFLLYMVVSDAKRRWIWMVSAVAVALTVQSLTLIIVELLIFTVLMRISFMTIFFTLLITAAALAAGDGLSYYTDRVMLSSDSTNLSKLVYLSGWERAWLSMNETLGLGYGLNQLGIVGNQGDIMRSLADLNAEGLNALDGGSVASKLIAEFGSAGMLLLMIYARFFLKGVRFVRSAMLEKRPVSRIELFFWSCLIMYSIDLFIRGTGYFSAESFMFFGAIWGLAQHTRKRKGRFCSECGRSPGPTISNQMVGATHVM
jgi:hypothetical protein